MPDFYQDSERKVCSHNATLQQPIITIYAVCLNISIEPATRLNTKAHSATWPAFDE